MKFLDDQWYIMDGETMQELSRLIYALEADIVSVDKRLEIAAEIGRRLDRASRLAKKIVRQPRA